MRRLLMAGAAALALIGPASADPIQYAPRSVILNPDGSQADFRSIGGTGTTAPTVGTPQESSGSALPIPTGAPLYTRAASSALLGYWGFMNTGTALLTVVLDDGQGNTVTVLPGHPAPSAGDMGGSFGSADYGPHQGRIRVYGPAGSTFVLRSQ